MSTVSDLITDAMYKNGSLGQGDGAPTDADAAVMLRLLQRMLGTWANEIPMAYDTSDATVTLAAGTVSYATSLLTPSTRPTTIQSMFVRLSNIDYTIALISQEQYNEFSYKPAQGLPRYCFFDPAFPTGTLYFYPTPDAAYVCHAFVRTPLMATVTLATTVSLPNGYEAAIVNNLSKDGASYFGLPVTRELMEDARQSKAALRVTNYVPIVMDSTLSTGDYTPGWIRIKGDL